LLSGTSTTPARYGRVIRRASPPITPKKNDNEETLPLPVAMEKARRRLKMQPNEIGEETDTDWVVLRPGDNDVIQTTNFDPQLAVYITPWTGLTEAPLVTYLDTSKGNYSDVKTIQATGLTAEGFVINASGLAADFYPIN